MLSCGLLNSPFNWPCQHSAYKVNAPKWRQKKNKKIEWKQVLTPETLELLSGIGTKALKIIAATVYEWLWRERRRKWGNETENEEEKETKKQNENRAAGRCRERREARADEQRGTHLLETAAKLFVQGENKQETNQLQKSMSVEITANHCHFQKQERGNLFFFFTKLQ